MEDSSLSSKISSEEIKYDIIECYHIFQSDFEVEKMWIHKTAIHDKWKPFACVECAFRNAQYGYLNLHIQKTHVIAMMLKTHYD